MNHWRHWNSTLGGSSVVSASTPTRDLLISSGVQHHHLDKCPWRVWCTSLEHGHTSQHATVSRCPSFPHECRLVNHKLYQDCSRLGVYCEWIKQSVCSRFKSRLVSCRTCIRFLKPVNEPLTRYVKLRVAHAFTTIGGGGGRVWDGGWGLGLGGVGSWGLGWVGAGGRAVYSHPVYLLLDGAKGISAFNAALVLSELI